MTQNGMQTPQNGWPPWQWIILLIFVLSQLVAAMLFWWSHPELTQMQVFQAIAEWSIPARWM